MNPQEDALIGSVCMGDIDGVRAALAAGTDIHVNDDYALRWAVAYGHAETVNLLLAAGANVHVDNDAALRRSAYDGHAEMVNLLLAAGANIHANNDAALRYAAYHGHAEIVNRLLAAGADPVVAFENAPEGDRCNVANALDACAAVLTSAQRAALLAVSRPGELVQLRAIAAAAAKHRAIHR